jgi:ketosteroid isomerase-like protein
MATTTETTLEQRIRRLEATEEIRNLVARYCYAMDNRDIPATIDLFTDDVVIRSNDGKMDSRGRDNVLAMYQGRWVVLGPSFHWTHDVLVELDEDDPDSATGLISCHAEMTRNGTAQVTGIRYDDKYRREDDGRWRFSERALSYFYFCDPREYAETMEHPLRVRAYDTPSEPGWPESLETYRRYYEENPRS